MAAVGHDVAVALSSGPTCACAVASTLPGQHRMWECLLNYFAKYGSCPGFLPSCARDPAAWTAPSTPGGALLPAGKAAWRAFIATHGLI